MAERASQLFTSTAITEAAGEDAHERIEELEVIFGTYDQIEPLALRQCCTLRRLTLLNARLHRIAHLEPVAASLVHLCLSSQRIAKIEGLEALTQLRSLYLHHNRIERIEGLGSCRKLQTLWLYDNRISRIEGLERCSDLRELWLQSNEIKTLANPGLSSLANLQSLQLANNSLRHLDEFQHLRKLIVLRDLSFDDEHFGSNPIIHHPDYRSFALATLKQLRKLDGKSIKRSERSTMQDQFLTQTLEFNDRVEELTLAYQQELQAIAARRERGVSNAQMIQRELIEALNDVEACVLEGQAQIRDEKERQLRLRADNAQLLRENVDNIKTAFHAAADSEYERAMNELALEERQCCVMEMESMAEQEQALAIATIQAMFPSRIAFQQLLEHTPDRRFIASAFVSDALPSNQPDSPAFGLAILQIYRYFHRDLLEAFNSACAKSESVLSTVASGTELYLYMALNSDQVGPTLQHGLGSQQNLESNQESNAAVVSEWVFLFSNPATATLFYRGTTFDLDEIESDEGVAHDNNCSDKHSPSASSLSISCEPPLVQTYNLLLCRVRAPQVVELFYPQGSSHHDGAAATLESLLSVAVPREEAMLPPPPKAFLQLSIPGLHGGHVYMARLDLVHALILPQFVILASKRLTPPLKAKTMPSLPTIDSTKMLDECKRRLRDEVDAFHSRLHQEMDPATARVRAQLVQQQDGAREQLHVANAQVADEKRAQSELLRALLPRR